MEAGDQERSCSWRRGNAIGMQHPQGIAIVIMVLHPSVAHAVREQGSPLPPVNKIENEQRLAYRKIFKVATLELFRLTIFGDTVSPIVLRRFSLRWYTPAPWDSTRHQSLLPATSRRRRQGDTIRQRWRNPPPGCARGRWRPPEMKNQVAGMSRRNRKCSAHVP